MVHSVKYIRPAKSIGLPWTVPANTCSAFTSYVTPCRARSPEKAPAAVLKRRTIAVVINARRIALFMGVRLRDESWQASHQVYTVDCAWHFSSRFERFRQIGDIEANAL